VTQEATPKRVIAYMTPNAKEPFNDWLNSLRDAIGRNVFWRGFPAYKREIMVTANLSGKALANYECSSVLDTEFILVSAAMTL
jgi:hypothetical protein